MSLIPPIFVNEDGLITNLHLTIPVKVISEANNYDHWTKKRKRKIAQQQEVHAELYKALDHRKIQLPCTVHLVRIGPRELDSDNLTSAFKGMRDQIAKMIGVDDGETDKIRFTYAQEVIGIRKY